MGRNFLILFEEKEGSTAIASLLRNFNRVNLVDTTPSSGWEPFDLHCCGPISMRNYLRCLDLIYGDQRPYMRELNTIYTATARSPLRPFDKRKSVGFKMRFQPQRANVQMRRLLGPAFTHFSINRFRAHNVVAFVTMRQDVFRWALSRYHGDGTGQPGHLQFKLASGRIDRSRIPKIHVDLNEFGRLLETCEHMIARKKRLIDRLNRKGVTAWPMLYESFCDDKRAFFAEVLSRLDLPSTGQEIAAALEQGTRFKKVHPHDIHEFVVNADDVLEEFGSRYANW